MTTEPLSKLFRRAAVSGAGKGSKPRVVWEQVQQVLPGQRFVVGGEILTTSGRSPLIRAGDTVPVLHEGGKRQLILGHQVLKAQFHPVPAPVELALEILFFGVVNGTEGFWLATAQGVFSIKPVAAPGIYQCAWGRNSNAFLLKMGTVGGGTLEVYRINRSKDSTRVPVVPDVEVAGLPVVDATMLGTFPGVFFNRRPDIPIPGVLQASVDVRVFRELHGRMREEIFGSDPDIIEDFRPLVSDMVSLGAFSGETTLNVDPTKATFAVFDMNEFYIFLDEQDHLIVIYEILYSPFTLTPMFTTPQDVKIYGARLSSDGIPLGIDPNNPPYYDELLQEGTRTVEGPSPQGTFDSRWASGPAAFFIGKVRVRPTGNGGGARPLQDFAVVDVTDGVVLRKSFDDIVLSWDEDFYVTTEFNFLLGLQAGETEQEHVLVLDHLVLNLHLGADPCVILSTGAPIRDLIGVHSKVFNFAAGGRDFFGLHAPAPLVSSPGAPVVCNRTLFQYTYSPIYVVTFHDEEFSGVIPNFFSSGPLLPQIQEDGFAFIAKGQRSSAPPGKYKVVRWDPSAVVTLAERSFDPDLSLADLDVLAHDAAVYARFQSAQIWVTDRERSLIDPPPSVAFVTPDRYTSNVDGDRSVYRHSIGDADASLIQTATPGKDLLDPDAHEGVTTIVPSFVSFHVVEG